MTIDKTDPQTPSRLIFVSLDKEIVVLARQLGHAVIGILAPDRNVETTGIPWLGRDEDWVTLRASYRGTKLVMALDPARVKGGLVERFYRGDDFMTLVADDATVGPGVELGEGTVVQHGVSLITDIKIGRNCKINHAASVHHDCIIGDFCTLAPGCRLLGDVTLAAGVFIGAGAIILPHRQIGEGAIIGAGAVVNRDVEKGTTVAGIPARKLK